jgi:hypothetical protein
MSVHKTQPPWEFLLSASRNSLQSFELSRLGHAANLRKEIGALLDQWIDESSAAMLARWLMEQGEHPLRMPGTQTSAGTKPAQAGKPVNGPGAVHSVSDNFLADQAVSPPVTRGSA